MQDGVVTASQGIIGSCRMSRLRPAHKTMPVINKPCSYDRADDASGPATDALASTELLREVREQPSKDRTKSIPVCAVRSGVGQCNVTVPCGPCRTS